MVVCSCNFIREQQIRDAARKGLCDVVEIYAELGHEFNCCQCVPFAEQIVLEESRLAA